MEKESNSCKDCLFYIDHEPIDEERDIVYCLDGKTRLTNISIGCFDHIDKKMVN